MPVAKAPASVVAPVSAPAVDVHSPPPTLASGYGYLTIGDAGKPYPLILENHERTIRHWAKRLDHVTLHRHGHPPC